jgi:methylmalonyl-CoA mutase N-terminal domain/subunit
LIVGVNCFTGEEEIEVNVQRSVLHPYDPGKRAEAEERQIKNLAEVKRIRDYRNVSRLLGELKEKAKREDENLIPHFVECVKAYATLQEMCDVLRDVFGEYEKESVI